jgi:molecular chaperone GrpE (heat shock protein)
MPSEPSAIAQAAAREIHDGQLEYFELCCEREGCKCGDNSEGYCEECHSRIDADAALIDKHIAPLREEIENLEQEGCEIQKAYTKAEAEIERLKKQLEGK